MTMQANIRPMQQARIGGVVRSVTHHPSVEHNHHNTPSYNTDTDWRARQRDEAAIRRTPSAGGLGELPTTEEGLKELRTSTLTKLDGAMEKVLRETQYGAGDSNGLSREQVIKEFQKRNGLEETGTLDPNDQKTRDAVVAAANKALDGRREELRNGHPDTKRREYLSSRLNAGNDAISELLTEQKKLGEVDRRIAEPTLTAEQKTMYSDAMNVVGSTGQFQTLRDEKLSALRGQNLDAWTLERRTGRVDQEVIAEFGRKLLNGETVNGIPADKVLQSNSANAVNVENLRAAVDGNTMNEDLMRAIENYSGAMSARRSETHSNLMRGLSRQDRQRGLDPDRSFGADMKIINDRLTAFRNSVYPGMGRERPAVETVVADTTTPDSNTYMP